MAESPKSAIRESFHGEATGLGISICGSDNSGVSMISGGTDQTGIARKWLLWIQVPQNPPPFFYGVKPPNHRPSLRSKSTFALDWTASTAVAPGGPAGRHEMPGYATA
jgi:hypothetical protein